MKKLLIIEDDIDIIDIIAYLFEGQEFEVYKHIRSIPLAEIIELNPNIIILDHHLGSELGKDLCLAIKQHPETKHIPVILFSAAMNLETLAADSCADAFITKPFDLFGLEKIVKEMAL